MDKLTKAVKIPARNSDWGHLSEETVWVDPDAGDVGHQHFDLVTSGLFPTTSGMCRCDFDKGSAHYYKCGGKPDWLSGPNPEELIGFGLTEPEAESLSRKRSRERSWNRAKPNSTRGLPVRKYDK